MKNTNNEKGQIIIIAIVFLAILTTMSAALVSYTFTQVQASKQSYLQGQALYLAEAGFDKALYALNQNPNYAGETDTALGEGVFTVEVTGIDANNKRITSTGYIPNSSNPKQTRIVRGNVNIDLSTISFSTGVHVGIGGLEMKNNARVNGNVLSGGNIVGTNNPVIAGDAIVTAGVAVTPDQESVTQNSDFQFGHNSSTRDASQSFIPTTSGTLTKISMNLRKVGTPSDLTFRLVTDNSGSPSKTVLGSGSIAASAITSVYNFIEGGFGTSVSVTAGQKYWIIVTAGTSSSNHFFWARDNTDGYVPGTGKYSANWNASTPVWNSANGDLGFKIFLGGIDYSLSGVSVTGNAWAHSMFSCTITGNAYYNSNNTCAVGGTLNPGQADQPAQPLPISEAQIAEWKATALAGGVTNGPLTITNTVTMGPRQINGNLTVTNDGILRLTGPIWVKGDILFDNDAQVTIDPSLGSAGTVIIADNPDDLANSGKVILGNNTVLSGTGQTGSYPLILSTSTNEKAIELKNNAEGAIFYASAGTIDVSNNTVVNQLTGYKIALQNNVIINYTSGLANANFSSGPGGSWALIPGTYVIVK